MSRSPFTGIRTEGGLLPQEILQRAAAGDPDLPGTDQAAYHLPAHERLGEAINRSWNRVRGLWTAFQDAAEERPETDLLTGLTRERWLLPLFHELGYGRLQRAQTFEIEGKSFAISHLWGSVPIHLVGTRVSIDRRTPGVAGAAGAAPHSLVQEFLNRSDDHLWALVSNGNLHRILRDSHSLSRQAFVEFDLQAIMDGEAFSDFRLLWLLSHQSRVEAEDPEECWLESWFQHHREEGVRALDRLREGVENAIEALGAGFIKHPGNTRLHEALQSGSLDRQEYYRELLRLVYRLIFLFVAEDREALLDPSATQTSRRRYSTYYSTRRLRELAGKRRGTKHTDLWEGFQVVSTHLFEGCPELGLPALGSFLWDPQALPWTGDAALHNEDFLSALRSLCYFREGKQRVVVNWRTVGSEELGSIYESLLELHPKINREAGTFELDTAAGHERKTTGSYYTPTSLVDALLDSALEPVLKEAVRKENPADALLNLKVCDTAAGSGHFLVAAARRIAARLASVRTGDEEASPEAVTAALRDVVGRCVYGVDLNPLAVELCKVSLWMEALEPGKPLSFLDHHIQVGNSLLGTTPLLLEKGIPDEAFKAIEGDDKATVTELRKRNKKERQAEQISFTGMLAAEPPARYLALEYISEELNEAEDSTLEDVRKKEALYQKLLDAPGHQRERLISDAWCAAFVWPKKPGAPEPITEEIFRQLEKDPKSVPAGTTMEAWRLADLYRFFHFHLAFPDVFHSGRGRDERSEVTGWAGGFDVVLGNPPWDLLRFSEAEFFSESCPEIALAPTAAVRKKKIGRLDEEDPVLYRRYLEEVRLVAGANAFVRSGSTYPLCGTGRVNLFALFSEKGRTVLSRKGKMGLVVPSGIVSDDSTKLLFQELMEAETLISLYDFENRKAIFPGVHRSYKLCLLTVGGADSRHKDGAEFAFFLHEVKDLDHADRRFQLSADDIALLNPNTRTCPIFRTRRDAEVTKGIYRRMSVVTRSGWDLELTRLLNQSDDSGKFEDETGPGLLPLYEGKYFHHYDHRWVTHERGRDRPSTDDERVDPHWSIQPRYCYPADDVRKRFGKKWDRSWAFAWRDISRSTDERSFIASVVPSLAIPNTAKVVFPPQERIEVSPSLIANMGSLVFDFVARQKIGGTHMSNYIVEQLPVLSPDVYRDRPPWVPDSDLNAWLFNRVIELTYTAWDLREFAQEFGHPGPPFRWNPDRRFLLRSEVDAAFFHLYEIPRDDVDHVIEAFPILRRKDVAEFGEYRTKRLILEIYDEMAEATRTGDPYQTHLDPPPAHPSLAHSEV